MNKANHDQYLYALASEKARNMIENYRNELGMDRDIGGPAPRPMLIALLVEMHRTAELVREGAVMKTVDAAEAISRWLLPVQPANPVYAQEIIRTTQEILKRMDNDTIHVGSLPAILQRLFDAGREAGMDQEAMRYGDRRTGSTEESADAEFLNPASQIIGQGMYEAAQRGLDPHAMASKIAGRMGAEFVKDRMEERQCAAQRGMKDEYPGEYDQTAPEPPYEGRTFRSFGDRRP